MKLFFLIVFIVGGFQLSAKNYYVSAKIGRTQNSGLSAQNPKKTIQEAADLTQPGDTVFVMNGTYSNDCETCNVVEIPHSGTSADYIVYTNYPLHKPILSFDGWAGFSIKNGTSYIKIIGLEIVGNNAKVKLRKALKQPNGCGNKKGDYDPKFNGNGISIGGNDGKYTHHIVIAKNIVRECGGGIGAIRSDYITVEDNVVYNNSWYTVFGTSGIAFYQFYNYDYRKGYHNFIRRNKCFNNRNYVPWSVLCKIYDGNGIIIDDFRNQQFGSKLGPYEGRTLIENNVCWYNGGTGIHSFQSDHIDIINNTAYCNSQSKELNSGQILASLSDDIRIANNIMVSDHENIVTSDYSNTNTLFSNNLYYNITYPANRDGAHIGLKNVKGLSPNFVLPEKKLNADFRLRNSSPAIDRGNVQLFSKVDFNNKDRVGIPDLGAYENASSYSQKQALSVPKNTSFLFFLEIVSSLWFILVPVV